MHRVARHDDAFGELARVADDQRNHEGGLVDAVMIEVAVVLVERFAVVSIDDDDGLVGDAQLFEAVDDLLAAGVHVGQGAVVACIYELDVRDARRHP